MTEKLILSGLDNSRKPRQNYADKIAPLDDVGFLKEVEQKIWLSAYANDNSRSDYHWMADACYDEAKRRNKPELYTQAYKKAKRQL